MDAYAAIGEISDQKDWPWKSYVYDSTFHFTGTFILSWVRRPKSEVT